MLTYFVDLNDIGMLQSSGGFGLQPQTLKQIVGCDPARQEHLERYMAVQPNISRK